MLLEPLRLAFGATVVRAWLATITAAPSNRGHVPFAVVLLDGLLDGFLLHGRFVHILPHEAPEDLVVILAIAVGPPSRLAFDGAVLACAAKRLELLPAYGADIIAYTYAHSRVPPDISRFRPVLRFFSLIQRLPLHARTNERVRT